MEKRQTVPAFEATAIILTRKIQELKNCSRNEAREIIEKIIPTIIGDLIRFCGMEHAEIEVANLLDKLSMEWPDNIGGKEILSQTALGLRQQAESYKKEVECCYNR